MQVSCGGDHTVVVSRQEGRVYSWGHGTSGQTGHGYDDLVSLPKPVDALSQHFIEQVQLCRHNEPQGTALQSLLAHHGHQIYAAARSTRLHL